MEGRPLRPRDGPKIGDQRPEPFGRLDAQLQHQQLPVPGELPKRFGGVALCDMYPDQRGSGAFPERLGPNRRERSSRSIAVVAPSREALGEHL